VVSIFKVDEWPDHLIDKIDPGYTVVVDLRACSRALVATPPGHCEADPATRGLVANFNL